MANGLSFLSSTKNSRRFQVHQTVMYSRPISGQPTAAHGQPAPVWTIVDSKLLVPRCFGFQTAPRTTDRQQSLDGQRFVQARTSHGAPSRQKDWGIKD